MDKKIWTRYIIALTAVLLLLWYVNAKNSGYQADSSEILPFTTEEISAFEIVSGTGTLRMQKSDSLWTWTHGDTTHPSPAKVNRAMEALSGEKGSFLTEKTDSYGMYNVDSTALLLRIFTGDAANEQLSLYIGKSSSQYTADHIRYTDDPRVYMTKKKLLNTLSTDSSFWK